MVVQLPAKFASIPRENLLFNHPSPIEKLSGFSAHISRQRDTSKGPINFWIKREDCNSGIAYGGNKIRKLEYVIADALEQGCDTLITTGGVQSNHMRQTAGVAAKYGLKVVLTPADIVAERPSEYYTLGNVQITSIFSVETLPFGRTLDEAAEEVKRLGGRPYIIPAGASAHPLGGLGYARCAFEIIEQERSMDVRFDTIVLTAGSGSTLAGLIAGFALAAEEDEEESKFRRRLIGIDIAARPEDQTESLILNVARNTSRLIGVKAQIDQNAFENYRRYSAGAYGRLNEATVDGIKLLAHTDGILLDPVYTGKTFTGLQDMAMKGELQNSQNVLFIHTGGQPALSAYPEVK